MMMNDCYDARKRKRMMDILRLFIMLMGRTKN